VPDSGTPAAIGYAQASGVPYGMGIVRNQYVGRTFIEPTEHIRNMGVRLKLNINRALVAGKRVVLVDDSVVRGTTSRKIKEMILDAGAAEVHFRIASPPTAWPCFYGVDTPQREKLLAATMSEDEMRGHLGVDSLRFLSLDGLYRAVGEAGGRDAGRAALLRCLLFGRLPGGAVGHDRRRLRDKGSGRVGARSADPGLRLPVALPAPDGHQKIRHVSHRCRPATASGRAAIWPRYRFRCWKYPRRSPRSAGRCPAPPSRIVRAIAAIQRVVPVAAHDHVVAFAALQMVRAIAAIKRIATTAAQDEIVAVAAVDQVGASPAMGPVIAGMAVDHIVAAGACQRIVTRGSRHDHALVAGTWPAVGIGFEVGETQRHIGELDELDPIQPVFAFGRADLRRAPSRSPAQ
jgi:hypothetical protein